MHTDIDRLNYPFSIQRIAVTPAYTDQETGQYVPAVETATPLEGNLGTVTYERVNRDQTGVLKLGDRIFATGTPLANGDKLRVAESDGKVTEWVVVACLGETTQMQKFLNITRHSYALRRLGTVAEGEPYGGVAKQ